GEPVAELQPEPVVADVHAEAFGHQVFDDHAGTLEVAVLVDEVAPVGVQVLAFEVHAPAVHRTPGQPRVYGGTPARDFVAQARRAGIELLGPGPAGVGNGLQVDVGGAQ